MTDAQEVMERTAVRLLRVSHVATRVCDDLHDVGDPDAFEALLQAPAPVRGLALDLPYVDRVHTPVEVDLWSLIGEAHLTGPLNASGAKQLRKAAVPLRARADLAPDGGQASGARAEVHLHPFGAVGIATYDLAWASPAPLADAWSEVVAVERQAASLTVAGSTTATTLGEAAGLAAQQVVDLFAAAGAGRWEVPDYRVATVVDGAVEPVPDAMPVDASPLHVALHHLSGGGDPPAPPDRAFVPTWSNGGFRYWPRQLAYLVDKGAAVWAAPADGPGPGLTLGQQHRRLTLLLAHLTASVGLVDASRTSPSASVASWADKAAKRLSRLYGPTDPRHGFEPRRYLEQTGFAALVETVLGTGLAPSTRYPLPPYGPPPAPPGGT
ncbi:MAG TPA: hypothetical protein VGB14_08645 [Acidimicrobiales bacterium]